MKYSEFLHLVINSVSEATPYICNNLKHDEMLKPCSESYKLKLKKTIDKKLKIANCATLSDMFRMADYAKTGICQELYNFSAERKAWLLTLANSYSKKGK